MAKKFVKTFFSFLLILSFFVPNKAEAAFGEVKELFGNINFLENAFSGISAKKYSDKLEFDENNLALGGDIVGMNVSIDGIMINDLGKVETSSGDRFPAREAGIEKGDIIKTVNGQKVKSVREFTKTISDSENNEVRLSILRGTEEEEITVLPACDKNGERKIGIYAKDSIAGIGTVTFYDIKTGSFASLGHGICASSQRVPVPMVSGMTYKANFGGVNKSVYGKPGEIRGSLSRQVCGITLKNCETGIYGVCDIDFDKNSICQIEKSENVTKGKAKIISTVTPDGKKEYDAEIEEIIDRFSETKNFIISITDRELLETTGGIVQGMSGSPIMQNGKLIGAVTHVLVNDPTKGYGIFIENMLETANKAALELNNAA